MLMRGGRAQAKAQYFGEVWRFALGLPAAMNSMRALLLFQWCARALGARSALRPTARLCA